MGEIFIASFQFRDEVVSAAELAGLGGPTAPGIGVPTPDCVAGFLVDDFESYADDAALAAAGWSIVAANTPVENANWTITNPCARVNPPTLSGGRSTGKFVISDSDCAAGGNVEGSGQSHDLLTPVFSTAGSGEIWLHADCSAQLNNDAANATAVFDIDVSIDGGATWTNAFRRIAPGTRLAPAPDNTNADGFFGRLEVNLSALAANEPAVRVRVRHFEPTDDWWIALDNVRIDCSPPPEGDVPIFSENFAAGLGAMSILSLAGNAGTETWHTTDVGNRYVAGTVQGRGVNRINHPNVNKEFAIIDSAALPGSGPEADYLATPVLDLSDYCDVYLHFKSEALVHSNATMGVVYSLDGGASVAGVIFKYNDTTGASGPNALFDSDEEPFYAERTFSVPATAGQATVVFAFLYQTPAGDLRSWWALDDIRVTANECEVVGETCDNPVEVAVPSSTNGTTEGAGPDNTGGCGANNSPAVWFKVVGTGRDITAQLCGSPFDTRLSVFSDGCPMLTCVGDNDDSCGSASRVHWASAPGVEYLLRVFGFSDSDSGGFTLTVLDSPVPANDLCASAVVLDLSAQNPAVVAGTNRGATVDSEAPACGTIRAPGVWYTVAGTGGDMSASTCNAANFDSRISVFSGTCGALTCVAENDDADGCDVSSQVSWASLFGETYYLLVHGFDALPGRYHVGDFELSVSGEPRPCVEITECRANQVTKQVLVRWSSVAPNVVAHEVYRNGDLVGQILSPVDSITDTPPLTPGCPNVFTYEVVAVSDGDPGVCRASCRVILSPGNVCFADDFEGYATDVDLELAGYFIIEENNPNEFQAAWTITNPGFRANPPTFDGRPSTGRFAISDSDFSGGEDTTGSGMSHDLWSPSFSTMGKTAVWLHMDVSAQLNNNGVVVFDVDVSTNGGVAWTNLFRRVAPSRTVAPLADTTNSDGFFGTLDVDLSSAAGRPDVRFRLRQFEPNDDWWIAVDNVIVDDVAPKSGGSECLLGPEGFDGGIPAGWNVVSGVGNGGNATWNTADPCGRRAVTFPHQDGQGVHRLGGGFAIHDTDCDDGAPHPLADDYLITRPVDCSGMEAVFLHWTSEIVADSPTVQRVLVSLDGGASFLPEPLFSYNAGGLFDPREEPFHATRVFSVPEAAGAENVAFAFHVQSATRRFWWAIDDVKVTADPLPPEGPFFIRGDCDNDGFVGGSVNDAVFYLLWAFQGGNVPACLAACDFDENGFVGGSVNDPVNQLNWAFLGGPPPAPPFPDCQEPTEQDLEIGCGASSPGCP
jgi:hypothetical protein